MTGSDAAAAGAVEPQTTSAATMPTIRLRIAITLALGRRDRRSRSAALAGLYPFAERVKRGRRALLCRRCGQLPVLNPLRAARDLGPVTAVCVAPRDLGDLGEQVVREPDRVKPKLD